MKMARAVAAFVLLAVSAWGMDSQMASSLTFEEAGPNRPVTKVINLLKDMLKELEKEAEKDQEIFDTMACWCETNEKEKTASIKKAQARIDQLKAKIEEDTALSAKLESEMRELEAEIAKNQEALDKATSIREKELAEFNGQEKELLEAVTALKSAVTVLEKHQGGAFLQMPGGSGPMNVAVTLQRLMMHHTDRLEGVLTHKERRAASAFIQAPDAFVQQAPGASASYAPQSGQIFGILSQMMEAFEKDLSEAQKQELANQKAYEELKAAKVEQIEAGQALVDKKSQEKAETDERLANSKVDLEETEESLAADEKFMVMLKEKCSMTDDEWEERQKTRAAEMEAVSKALAIISGDDAHDLYTRTFNKGGASFLQERSALSSASRVQASALLSAAAKRLHSQSLAKLAMSVRLDAFTKVKKAIDDMIAALTEQQAAEVKHKDFCVAELDENALQTEKKTMEKEDLEAMAKKLENAIKRADEEIKTLETEIVDMKEAMKRAGEVREKENLEFQNTVADQRATQVILKKALKALESFYGKQKALLQQDPDFNPPAGFDEYKKNEQSGGVMALIQQIIADAKKMEDETVRDEQDAQKIYEAFVIETNLSTEAKGKEIVSKTKQKAKDEKQLVQTKEDLESKKIELEELADTATQLHSACDFTLKNFDLRQEARMEEMDALRQAKQILSGADFGL